MNINNLALSISVFVSVWSAGCGEEPCKLDSQCYSDEICMDGECAVGERNTSTNNTSTNNTSTNNTSTNNTSTNNTSTTNTSTNNSTNNASNNTSTNNTSTNNTSTNNTSTNNVSTFACEVDPSSAVCHSPDDNDRFHEMFVTSTVGCVAGDVLIPLNETRSMQLCSSELADRFTLKYVDCATRSFIMEVIFTPQQECDRSLFETSVNIAGNNCEEPNTNIVCEDLPNGGLKVTGVVPAGRSVSLASFTVEALDPNRIQFDYDLQWTVRE